MRNMVLVLMTFFLAAPLVAAQPEAASSSPQAMVYGRDPMQGLDFWRARGAKAPLIVFVHGGGWSSGDKTWVGSAMPAHFLARGYAFASLGYRLVPDVTVEQQVQDVADAVGFLVGRAEQLGLDTSKVVLIGHSSGGHVVALIGTDPRFLHAEGLDLAVLKGVVLLEGAGLAPQARRGGGGGGGVFGTEAERQALAPVAHAAKPNAGSFLMLQADSADLKRQSDFLAHALREAGTPTRIEDIANSGHNQLVSDLGIGSHPETAIVDAFLKQVFGN
jgi:acetyl esterase/lipase